MFGTRNLKKYLSYLIPILGIAVILSLAGVMWWWEIDGRQRAFYVDVPVMKTDLKRGDLIKEDMFTTTKVEKDKLIDNYVKDTKDIIGLEAKQYIPKNLQLDILFFESPNLITNDKRRNWKIPNDWIYSIPNSLRRKDSIVFYQIFVDGLKNDKNIHIESSIQTVEDAKKIDQSGQVSIKFDNKSSFTPEKNAVIYSAIVSYVKDSANREVVSTNQTDRIDANSTIKDLEIIATKEDIDMLAEIVSKGNKFIIGYSDGEGTLNESKIDKQ